MTDLDQTSRPAAADPYPSPSAFADARRRQAGGEAIGAVVADLVDRLTPAERLDLLDGDLDFWPGISRLFTDANKIPWYGSGVERLGIPRIAYADGPRGCVIGASTAFPVAMARGAAFDPDLETRIGEAIGREARAQGVDCALAVCINLLRHPAWGRAQETYGEDPHHVGEMGAALTRGLQRHVMANVKHYALNSMENARFSVDVIADERALHEVYLPHFRRVVAEGVATVMTAYNSVNGAWASENADLLGILLDEWGFEGVVVSDWVLGTRDAVASVEAGLTVEMPFRMRRHMALPEALADGTLDQGLVDAHVTRLLTTALRWAWVADERPDPAVVVACPEHRALAREASAASMVLLRNEGVLPVDPTALSRVAVLGPLAAVENMGDHGSSHVNPPEVVTPLEGLRAALGPDVDVVHHDEDVALADDADLTVVVVGYTHADEGEYLDTTGMQQLAHLFPPWDHPTLGVREGETITGPGGGGDGPTMSPGGDRSSLRLSAADEALIAAAAARTDRLVVCVMAGSAVVMPWLEEVPAALLTWYPGMAGGSALADVLTGVAEPGGRLPFAIPVDGADLVDFDRTATTATYGLLHGQWHLDATGAATHLPFGWGLGYTTVELADPRVEGDALVVTATNTGERAGTTVVQVHASVPGSAFARPPRRLVGFAKVALDPGASQPVQVALDLDQLRVRVDGGWVTEDAEVVLHVGQHAHDDALPTVTVTPDVGRR